MTLGLTLHNGEVHSTVAQDGEFSQVFVCFFPQQVNSVKLGHQLKHLNLSICFYMNLFSHVSVSAYSII